MRNAYVLLVLAVVLLVTGGCGSSSQMVSAPQLVPQQSAAASTLAINREERSSTQQRYVEVYKFGGDDWKDTWKPNLRKPSSTEPPKDVVSGIVQESKTVYGKLKRVRGYRVQLANVTEEGSAKSIERRAKALFETVYVTFQSPSYKVRGGDFTKRSDADAAAEEARGMGFRGAWVVPDQVNVWVGGPPPPAEMEEAAQGAADNSSSEGQVVR